VVFGEVRDAGSGARLAGAVARVRWIAVDTVRGRLAVRPEGRDVYTDSVGTWVACGLPTGVPLDWRAVGGGSASGRAVVTLDPALPLARVDLWLAPVRAAATGTATGTATGAAPAPTGPADAAAAHAVAVHAAAVHATASPADSARRGVVRGTIRDSTGAPLSGARVMLDEADPNAAATDGPAADEAADSAHAAGDPPPRGRSGEARTGDDGRFTLVGVPLGTQALVVRALRYRPELVPVVVRGGAPTQVDVTLQRVVTLAAVTVRADRLAQLNLDMARRRRLGMSLTADVSIYRSTRNLAATIAALPYLFQQNLSGRERPARAKCREPLMLLDGEPMRFGLLYDPEDIIAIEFFRPNTRSPRWHGGLEPHPCEVIALYTERWGERRLRR
jgi:hypothetical protein